MFFLINNKVELQSVFIGVNGAISAPNNNIHTYKIRKIAKIREGFCIILLLGCALKFIAKINFKVQPIQGL